MSMRHVLTSTRLGLVMIAANGDAITGLHFLRGARRPARAAYGPQVAVESDALLADASAQLHEYLGGTRREFDLPLDATGDEFQHAVWGIVAQIPFGETTTYGAIAERLGDASLAYRVGQAVGANPLGIVVPCHRVLGANGRLTGYAGGLERKRALLDLEEPAEIKAERLF